MGSADGKPFVTPSSVSFGCGWLFVFSWEGISGLETAVQFGGSNKK
jgi:hypothetical protein